MSKIKKNPVLRKALQGAFTDLTNSEREKIEKRKEKMEKKKEELEKRIKNVETTKEKDWRDMISDKKLEEISNRVPKSLWNKLSFHKQLLEYLDRKRKGEFQGAYI